MKKLCQYSVTQTAMRAVLAVKAAYERDPQFTMGSVARDLRESFGMGRATSFRRVREAIDILGIHYHGDDMPGGYTGAKLTSEMVRTIRSSHLSIAKMADQLGVSRSCVQRARCGKSWGDVA